MIRKERTQWFYLAVEKTGELGSSDEIELISREHNQWSITDIIREQFNLR